MFEASYEKICRNISRILCNDKGYIRVLVEQGKDFHTFRVYVSKYTYRDVQVKNKNLDDFSNEDLANEIHTLVQLGDH